MPSHGAAGASIATWGSIPILQWSAPASPLGTARDQGAFRSATS
jgi:hypothetical protein